MKKAIGHLRANAVAYLALFVALGGTGYAAISIPRSSVGTRQLRNGAVTNKKLANKSIGPAKLNPTLIGATVRAWAEILPSGVVKASSEPAQTTQWNAPNAPGLGFMRFGHPFPSRGYCFALANVESPTGNPELPAGTVTAGVAVNGSTSFNGVRVEMSNLDGTPGTQLPVLVAVLCSR